MIRKLSGIESRTRKSSSHNNSGITSSRVVVLERWMQSTQHHHQPNKHTRITTNEIWCSFSVVFFLLDLRSFFNKTPTEKNNGLHQVRVKRYTFHILFIVHCWNCYFECELIAPSPSLLSSTLSNGRKNLAKVYQYSVLYPPYGCSSSFCVCAQCAYKLSTKSTTILGSNILLKFVFWLIDIAEKTTQSCIRTTQFWSTVIFMLLFVWKDGFWEKVAHLDINGLNSWKSSRTFCQN